MNYSLLIAAGLCFAIAGCNKSESHKLSTQEGTETVDSNYKLNATENETDADSVAVGNGSSAAAVENARDAEHKFIRTADVKFKVKNVEKTTYTVEDIINSHGGFVTNTHLNSTIDHVATTPISADSSLETTTFTVTNNMTVRVPNIMLDTTLKDIARLVDYLDYRIIKANDVSLQLQGNDMAQKRLANHQQRLTQAINSRGKKLTETEDAETLLLHKQEQADDAMLTNMSLNDEMKYSTVQLSMYQRSSLKRELVSNDKNIAAYQPGFGSRLLNSLQYGLEVLAATLVGIAKIWWIIVFTILGWIIYKRYMVKLKHIIK